MADTSHSLFNDIKARAARSGKVVGTKAATDWFRDAARAVSSPSAKKIIDQAAPFRRLERLSINSIGKLYLFTYDPKGKETLPYYDTYPLIFPIEFYSDGMLGINLHYLPVALRARLMNALYETINNTKYNNTTKLQISYKILKGASKFAYFTPCIKRYLFSHVRSPFMYVAPDEWDFAMMLPIQKFVKASAEDVWRDSIGKVS